MPQRLITIPLQQLEGLIAESWSALRGHSRYRDVPALDPSLGLIGEALLDRAFTTTTSALVGVPSPERVRSAQQEAQAARDLFAARGWLEDPESYHQDPTPLVPRDLVAAATWTAGGRRRYRHLRAESGYAPHEGEPGRARWLAHPHNGTSHAYLLEHEGGPRPWLLCVHGFAMGSPRISFAGFPARELHDELGLNLALPVLPLHGPRSASRFSGGEVLDPDYMRMVHLFAQAAWDLRRLIRWLRARGAPRIGLYGISLGAYVSSLVASLEPDVDCIVAGIPAVDFPNLARDNEPWVLSRYDDDLQMDWSLVRAVTHPVSPLAMPPRVPHAGRFIYAGLADRVVKPDQPRALWRHWGHPEIHWFSGGHVLGVRNASIVPFLKRALTSSGLVVAS